MSLDPNKTYLTWEGSNFPNSSGARFRAPAGSTIDWGDGTPVETFDTASTTRNEHKYTDGKTEHTIVISGLKNIAAEVFSGCSSLISITIPNSTTRIGEWAFYSCTSLTSITIPDGVTSVAKGAFFKCSSLTSATIGNNVKSIVNNAFDGCSSLTSVIIGNNVESISDWAFANCDSLKTIVLFPKTPPTLASTNAIPTTISTIYVQQSSKEAYKTATNWTAFTNKIESNNTYLSLIRFNKKNKEYIEEKVNILKEYVDESINKSIITVLNTEV